MAIIIFNTENIYLLLDTIPMIPRTKAAIAPKKNEYTQNSQIN
jgi:hypothetical protein